MRSKLYLENTVLHLHCCACDIYFFSYFFEQTILKEININKHLHIKLDKKFVLDNQLSDRYSSETETELSKRKEKRKIRDGQLFQLLLRNQ